jgi:hypothetical protein
MLTKTVNTVVAMVSCARADQTARRAVAGLVLAAAPLLYAVPAGALQYSLVWSQTFANETGLLLLQAGMTMSCFYIPLAVPICVPLSLA